LVCVDLTDDECEDDDEENDVFGQRKQRSLKQKAILTQQKHSLVHGHLARKLQFTFTIPGCLWGDGNLCCLGACDAREGTPISGIGDVNYEGGMEESIPRVPFP